MDSVISPTLLIANVMHKRTQPKVNCFQYKLYYLTLPLTQLFKLSTRLFSVNRFNLLSLFLKDYGNNEEDTTQWIRDTLSSYGLDESVTGNIMLVTLPRIMGYAFNPVSFWFCLDTEHQIRAVISEVNNTFGDRHFYISYHDDHQPISPDDIMTSRKVFHVSPFLTIEGTYHYRFIFTAQRVAVWIDHVTQDGVVLHTSLIGKRIALTDKHLLICFLRYPFVTFKVISLIYWQAMKLYRKGIRYHSRPSPPSNSTTR